MLDDEVLIALDIQQALEDAGAAEVICATSAGEALAALHEGPAVDVAVLDVKLADRARDSMTVAVRLHERGTPFVFLTGLRADEIRGESFFGVPVVEKPFQASALIEAVCQALSTRRN